LRMVVLFIVSASCIMYTRDMIQETENKVKREF